MAGLLVLGVLATTLSTALSFGPAHALAWLTPQTLPALALGALLAAGCALLEPRAAAGLGLAVLGALVVLVNQAPVDPYFAAQPAELGAGPLHPFPWAGAVDRLAVALCGDGLAAEPAGPGRRGLKAGVQAPGSAGCAAYNSWSCAPRAAAVRKTPLSYYRHHIFFCVNQRDNGEACCSQHDPQAALDRCKSRVKAAGLAGPGGVRVNKAGCLDRCAGGPVAVVYPEAVWYTYVDQQDIDEIVESHLMNGQVVERLLMAPEVGR